eukprot:1175885-Amphidinium_carterae.1
MNKYLSYALEGMDRICAGFGTIAATTTKGIFLEVSWVLTHGFVRDLRPRHSCSTRQDYVGIHILAMPHRWESSFPPLNNSVHFKQQEMLTTNT